MTDEPHKNDLDASLEGIDEGRREALRKIIRGGVYVVPVVASFAIDGLTVSPAMAKISNFS